MRDLAVFSADRCFYQMIFLFLFGFSLRVRIHGAQLSRLPLLSEGNSVLYSFGCVHVRPSSGYTGLQVVSSGVGFSIAHAPGFLPSGTGLCGSVRLPSSRDVDGGGGSQYLKIYGVSNLLGRSSGSRRAVCQGILQWQDPFKPRLQCLWARTIPLDLSLPACTRSATALQLRESTV